MKTSKNKLLHGASVSGEQIPWQIETISIILIFQGGSVLNSWLGIYYSNIFFSSTEVMRKKIRTLFVASELDLSCSRPSGVGMVFSDPGE